MEIGPVQNNAQVLPAAQSVTDPGRLAVQPEVIQAVKAVNESELFGNHNELTFALDRETRRPVVRIVDRKTKEVVRQIPPEAVLRMIEDLKLLGS